MEDTNSKENKNIGWARIRNELKTEVFENIIDYQKYFKNISKIMNDCSQKEFLEKYIQRISKLFESLYDAREFIVPGVDEFKLIMKTDSFENEVYDVLRAYTGLMEIIDEIKNKAITIW